MRRTVIAFLTTLVVVSFSLFAFAQEYKPAPEDLQAFVTKLHDLSAAKDIKGLEMCVLPFFGMRAYGNSFSRMDFEDAMKDNYVREFQFESEGMIEVESLKLTEFLFGEYRCFGLLTLTPMDKGMLITEDERWSDELPNAYEGSGYNYLAFPLEEYENGDTVYCIDLSPYESQHVIIGKIGGGWYLLGFAPYE